MKRFVMLILICFFLFTALQAFAEEPILVIDPHGHSSQITDIMFTPDGKTLVSVSFDKTIRLWDVETGELIKTLRHQIGTGHDGEIHTAALSPDGKILVIGGITYGHDDEGTPVHIFDLESGEIIGLLKGNPGWLIASLNFSQDGKWLAISSRNTIGIWDMSNPGDAPVLTLENDHGAFDLAFSPDAKKLVSGHVDHTLRLWELPEDMRNTGQEPIKPKKILKKHAGIVNCVDYSPDGKYIISGDFNGRTFLWDSKKGKLKKKFPPMNTVSVLAFSPDSKKVVFGGGKDTSASAFVYSIPDGKTLTSFTQHGSPVESLAFSNNVTAAAFYGNDLIATAGGNDYEIYIWDVKTGEVKTHIAGQGKRVEAVAFGEGLQVAFGNTSGGLQDVGPLERSFDFVNMSLNQNTPPENEFIRTQTEFNGKKLQYTFRNWYELQVKGGGTIKNGPSDGWVRSYTFTPNGHVVVGSSQVLKLHRIDGELIREFVGHTGEVWAVSISRDGNILASASDDQTIKLWNIHTGECLATLFVTRDHEWVCWSPQGYYAASAGGEKYIGWQINQGMDSAALYHPVSVFRKQYHHPELVRHIIEVGNAEQVVARSIFKPTAVTQVLPPEMSWLSPKESPIEIAENTLTVRAKVRSDIEISDIKILVNGRPQATLQAIHTTGRSSPFYKEIDHEITLTEGRNDITIFAANENADAVSDSRVVLFSDTEAVLRPNLYMVSIGISDYAANQLRLNYAEDDASAISQVFLTQEGKMYKTVTVKDLKNREATRFNIIDALSWLSEHTTPQDVVVIFIAAHGFNSEKGKYYLLPADGNPEKLIHTGISWVTFSDLLSGLPSRVLLFLDTCFSGRLGENLSSQQEQFDNTEAIRIVTSEEYGIVVVAASTGSESSLEHPDWGHGAFTLALIEALKQGQADATPDGVIHLKELKAYLQKRVAELTKNQQHPTILKPSTISRFPIVKVSD